jgi:pyridinium-3,5-biscarboxylic acid mononucleotide sulfurtransferase
MIDDKFAVLGKILTTYGKVIVAFSGGIDSSFILHFAKETLGKENVVAVTGVSETYTKEEGEFAKKFTGQSGVEHVFINTTEFNNPDFIKNPKDRCYHCKKELYASIRKIAGDRNIPVIIDGTNDSDKGDYRPGKMAAKEFGVSSPMANAGITKEDIRNYLKAGGFDFYDKPANPCLASRIPYGDEITIEKLTRVEECERYLRSLGFRTVRVRVHDRIARIEVPDPDLSRLVDSRKSVTDFFKKTGFTYVSIDLEGYRTGSLNEVL